MVRRQFGSLCSALKFWVRVVNEHHRGARARGGLRGLCPPRAAQRGHEARLPLPGRLPAAAAARSAGAAGTECACVRVSGVQGCGSRLQSHEALRRAAASRVCVRVRVPALAPLSQEVLRKAVAPSLSARFPERGD